MSFFNKSFLKDMFFSAHQRDVLLGSLFHSLKSEGPSRHTRNTIIELAEKFPNDHGVEQCLSHTIGYVHAFYGTRAAYSITQDLGLGDDSSYNRVRNMATTMAQTLVFDMSLEPTERRKVDVMTTSLQAVSICEQFMKGAVKDSIVDVSEREARIKPLKFCEFFERLQY